MFQFPGFPTYDYLIHHTFTGSSPAWFPNSDIRGSSLICSYPRLFAACHVLLRLLMPRHSPYALFSLNLPCVNRRFFLASCIEKASLFRLRISASTKLSLPRFLKDLIVPLTWVRVSANSANLSISFFLSVSFASLFGFQWTVILTKRDERRVILVVKKRFRFFPSIFRCRTYLSKITFSLERRWSNRTFRYGYLVTT